MNIKSLWKNNKAFRWLCIALVLILVSGIGASAFESSGYSVEVEDMKMTWAEMATEIKANAAANAKDVVVTFDGTNGSLDMSASTKQISFKLLIPKTATAETPAPAVVCAHGYYNNKEMQDAFYVELARRGFVVIAMDMSGHGSSDVTYDPSATLYTSMENSGMEACVEWLMSQSYVDEANIGITGHSRGGGTCGFTMQHLIRAGHGDYVKASLGQASSANVDQVIAEFGDFPETHVAGTIMCRYDDFMFVFGNTNDYLNTDAAKAIVNKAYPELSGTIEQGRFYTAEGITDIDYRNGEVIEEKSAIIYWPNIVHAWAHFSSRCSGDAIDFFYSTLGVPSGAELVEPSNQIWQIKEVFNLLGLIGFFLLIAPLTSVLLQLPVFSPLRKGTALVDANLPEHKGLKQIVPFWLCGLLICFLSAAIFVPMYAGKRATNFLLPVSEKFAQPTANSIGMWALACGIISLALVLLFWAIRYLLNRKTADYTDNPFACAKVDSVSEFLRSILLACVVVSLLYIVVWVQYYIWGTDFRVWTLAVMPFDTIKLGAIFTYLPFFLFFYVVNGICNANNRFKNMPEWLSITLTCLFNVAGLIALILIQYLTMMKAGSYPMWLYEGNIGTAVAAALGFILLIPIVPLMAVANIVSRKIYLQTGSIWVGAAINGILFTIMFCVNTFTQYAYKLFY